MQNDDDYTGELNRIFVTDVLRVNNDNVWNDDSELAYKALSKMIPMILRCTAKHVEIASQHISLENLQFLIGNVVYLDLDDVCDSDEKPFPLESILASTPKIKTLRMEPVECTAETSQKLLELQFESKLDKIFLVRIYNNALDPVNFAEFVLKNCSSKAEIDLFFVPEAIDEDYIDRFREILGDAIDEKWSGKRKPKFCVDKSHH